MKLLTTFVGKVFPLSGKHLHTFHRRDAKNAKSIGTQINTDSHRSHHPLTSLARGAEGTACSNLAQEAEAAKPSELSLAAPSSCAPCCRTPTVSQSL